MLTLKRKLFIEHYKRTGNASKSAELAGYSHCTAQKTACRILRTKEVAEEIQKWEQSELKRLVPDTKEKYIEETFKRSSSVQHAPTAAKYWELAGKSSGYIGGDENKREDGPIFNIFAQQMSIRAPKSSQIGPQDIVVTPLGVNSDGENSTPKPIDINDLCNQCHLTQVMLSKESQGVGEGSPTTPGRGQNINVNPSENPPQILNSAKPTKKSAKPTSKASPKTENRRKTVSALNLQRWREKQMEAKRLRESAMDGVKPDSGAANAQDSPKVGQ